MYRRCGGGCRRAGEEYVRTGVQKEQERSKCTGTHAIGTHRESRTGSVVSLPRPSLDGCVGCVDYPLITWPSFPFFSSNFARLSKQNVRNLFQCLSLLLFFWAGDAMPNEIGSYRYLRVDLEERPATIDICPLTGRNSATRASVSAES